MDTTNSEPKEPIKAIEPPKEYHEKSPVHTTVNVFSRCSFWDLLITPTISGIKCNRFIQRLYKFCVQVVNQLYVHPAGLWIILSSLFAIFIGVPLLHKMATWILDLSMSILLLISGAVLAFGCYVVWKGMMNHETCQSESDNTGGEEKEEKGGMEDIHVLAEALVGEKDHKASELGKAACTCDGAKVAKNIGQGNTDIKDAGVGKVENKKHVRVLAEATAGNVVEATGTGKVEDKKDTKVVSEAPGGNGVQESVLVKVAEEDNGKGAKEVAARRHDPKKSWLGKRAV
ncbi:hypothetical protein BZA77DRAFT_366258 [Pyronema omphalodes]|nr:hypothetical protein BZA77DRAFT_366258 [Pyronema omphalodes]